jgi:hypothetical protein
MDQLTDVMRNAVEYFARREECPESVEGVALPKIGTRVALIRRGLLTTLADGRTQHELTEAGWDYVEAHMRPKVAPKPEPVKPAQPEVKTGPLTLREFEQLANLLRRFEVNHAPQLGPKLAIQQADRVIRHVYSVLYVPGYAPEGTEAGRRREFAEGTTGEARERWTDSDGTPITSEIGG